MFVAGMLFLVYKINKNDLIADFSTMKKILFSLFIPLIISLFVFVAFDSESAKAETNTSTQPLVSEESCSSFSNDLYMGSTGADVIALQTWLMNKGFDIPVLSSGKMPKGYFGNLTQAALAQYQNSVGLPSTGYFGPLSRAKLNGLCGEPLTHTSTSTPIYTPSPIVTNTPISHPISTPTSTPISNKASVSSIGKPHAEWSFVSARITSNNIASATSSNSVTGAIVFKAKAIGGAMQKPAQKDFSVVFASTTSGSFNSGNSIDITNFTLSVTPDRPTAEDGDEYYIVIGGTINSSNPKICVSQPLLMAVKDVDSNVGGVATINQTSGIESLHTGTKVLNVEAGKKCN
jgi:peptidoglycan hydrolase-like protein with peptidoglycan-binding domain